MPTITTKDGVAISQGLRLLSRPVNRPEQTSMLSSPKTPKPAPIQHIRVAY